MAANVALKVGAMVGAVAAAGAYVPLGVMRVQGPIQSSLAAGAGAVGGGVAVQMFQGMPVDLMSGVPIFVTASAGAWLARRQAPVPRSLAAGAAAGLAAGGVIFFLASQFGPRNK